MIRALLLSLWLIPTAAAQITLPTVPGTPVPGSTMLPGVSDLGLAEVRPQAPGLTRKLKSGVLKLTRKRRIIQLLRRYPRRIAADPRGNPIVRGEVIAIGPSASALARARAAGFAVLRTRSLAALGLRVVELRAPSGVSAPRALRTLRRLDPSGTYDFDHLYTDSGGIAERPPRNATPADKLRRAAANAPPGKLGLVDGGIETAHPVFRGTVIHQHGCGGVSVPSAHGTAVASLMIGHSARFIGAAPNATLYAANVFCAKPTGGSVTAIAAALDWLVAQGVPVINVSLVGPSNALLRRVVEAVLARGSLIVAAVGNDGPAAPPLYPAAYPGVIGVTAVNRDHRVLVEAERGPQVTFAAPGADIDAAGVPHGFARVRGTSFASPLVAGLLSRLLLTPDLRAAKQALKKLIRQATHLGRPGRNPVYGYGLVAAGLPAHR